MPQTAFIICNFNINIESISDGHEEGTGLFTLLPIINVSVFECDIKTGDKKLKKDSGGELLLYVKVYPRNPDNDVNFKLLHIQTEISYKTQSGMTLYQGIIHMFKTSNGLISSTIKNYFSAGEGDP